jgi:DNA helicase II / ATP-dependent DNA helicase PcrA
MIFENLTEEQKIAVKTDDQLGRLTHPNRRVVALTFTIRAAEEIERRLQKMNLDTAQLWSGNIHAFCLNWILRPYACFYPKTRRGFAIIDAPKTDDILENLIATSFPALKDDWKNKKIRVKLAQDGTFLLKNEAHTPVFDAYRQVLEENRFVDFEHLLWYSLDLLRSFPKIAATLSGIFQNILIDEFQDTQELQYQIIFEIVRAGKGGTKVCFVGDCDQAIYGSLGGVAKTQAEIEAGIGAKIWPCELSGNYRSNQRVIDFYRNFQTMPLEITAKGENADLGGLVTLNNTVSKDDLADEIARLIQLSLDAGVPEEEIGILVPQWVMIMPLSRKLKRLLHGVSFDASGIAPMSDSRDNLFYKISRLFLTEPSPRLYSVRQRWADEIGTELALSIADHPEKEEYSAKKVLKIVNGLTSQEDDAVAHLKECLTCFLDAFAICLTTVPTLEISFNSYFLGIKKRRARAEEEGETLPSDIASFRNFYREASGVVISSVHGSKGEEFETVIGFGLLRGYLPNWEHIIGKRDDDAEEIEASCKLLYVLCSRAKNNLHLIIETGRKTKKGGDYQANRQIATTKFNYDIIIDS